MILKLIPRPWAAVANGTGTQDGAPIDKNRAPEVATNLVFGGRRRSRLLITGGSSLYAVDVGTRGVQYP